MADFSFLFPSQAQLRPGDSFINGYQAGIAGEVARQNIARSKAQQVIEQEAEARLKLEQEQWNRYGQEVAEARNRRMLEQRAADIEYYRAQPWSEPGGPPLTGYRPTPEREYQMQDSALGAALTDATPYLPPRQIPSVLDKIEARKSREQIAADALKSRETVAQEANRNRQFLQEQNIEARKANEILRNENRLDIQEMRDAQRQKEMEQRGQQFNERMEQLSKRMSGADQQILRMRLREIHDDSRLNPDEKEEAYLRLEKEYAAKYSGQAGAAGAQAAPVGGAAPSTASRNVQAALERLDEFEQLGYKEAWISSNPETRGGGFKLEPVTGWWSGAMTSGEKPISEIRKQLLGESKPKEREKSKGKPVLGGKWTLFTREPIER